MAGEIQIFEVKVLPVKGITTIQLHGNGLHTRYTFGDQTSSCPILSGHSIYSIIIQNMFLKQNCPSFKDTGLLRI
jgi:hypothetical protein